jgi:hypothetical protein
VTSYNVHNDDHKDDNSDIHFLGLAKWLQIQDSIAITYFLLNNGYVFSHVLGSNIFRLSFWRMVWKISHKKFYFVILLI